MKLVINILAVLLIVFGIASLAYNGFTYTKQEKVAQIGNLELTNNTEKTLFISPAVGTISLVAGIVLIMIGRLGRKP